MQVGQRALVALGIVSSVAIHGAVGVGLVRMSRHASAPASPPASVLTVALIAAAPVLSVRQQSATPADISAPATRPLRKAIHYYLPEELERELILLRDRSGDTPITIPAPVVLHVFVDVTGKVVEVRFDSEPGNAVLAAQLRAAFMTLEFLPAQKDGHAVPARIKIALSPQSPP